MNQPTTGTLVTDGVQASHELTASSSASAEASATDLQHAITRLKEQAAQQQEELAKLQAQNEEYQQQARPLALHTRAPDPSRLRP